MRLPTRLVPDCRSLLAGADLTLRPACLPGCRYLAPECCRAKWYPVSDVWAVGVMACYLLTGKQGLASSALCTVPRLLLVRYLRDSLIAFSLHSSFRRLPIPGPHVSKDARPGPHAAQVSPAGPAGARPAALSIRSRRRSRSRTLLFPVCCPPRCLPPWLQCAAAFALRSWIWRSPNSRHCPRRLAPSSRACWSKIRCRHAHSCRRHGSQHPQGHTSQRLAGSLRPAPASWFTPPDLHPTSHPVLLALQRPSAEEALRHPFLKGKKEDRAAGKPLDKTVVQRIQARSRRSHRPGCRRPSAPRMNQHPTTPWLHAQPHHPLLHAPMPDAPALFQPSLPPLTRSRLPGPAAAVSHPGVPAPRSLPAALRPELSVQAQRAGAHCRRPSGHAFHPRAHLPRRLGQAPRGRSRRSRPPACVACLGGRPLGWQLPRCCGQAVV